MNNLSKTLFSFWFGLVIFLMVLTAWRLQSGIPVETNILKLLPEDQQQPAVQQVMTSFTKNTSHRLLFLIGHEKQEVVLQAANQFAKRLKNNSLFYKIMTEVAPDQQEKIFNHYFPHRYQLLTDQTRHLLQQLNAFELLSSKILGQIYSPLPSFNSQLLLTDPLMLFQDYLMNMSSTMELLDNRIVRREDGINWILMSASTIGDPFNQSNQQQVVQWIEKIKQQMQLHNPVVQFKYTGMIRFAHQAFEQSKKEVSLIGSMSLLGIVFLMMIAFRSVKPLLLALLAIWVGFLLAFNVCLFLYPKIHLITLVLGASLIGICVDYCFHYFVEHQSSSSHWDGWQGLMNIKNAIFMGLITTILGYCGFFLSPFPGLEQIAIFASVGLIGAYLTVVCSFPYWLRKPAVKRQSSDILIIPVEWFLLIWRKMSRQYFYTLIIALFVVIMAGLTMIQFDDDVRSLKFTPGVMHNNDQMIRRITDEYDMSRFILIQAETAEAVLQKMERLSVVLKKLKQNKTITNYLIISDSIPSIKRQKENVQRLLNQLTQHKKEWQAFFYQLGLPESVYSSMITKLNHADENPILLNESINKIGLNMLQNLWFGKTEHGYLSLVLLGKVNNESALVNINSQDVYYVNKVEQINQIFKEYRQQAMILVSLAYVLILILLIIRYRLYCALMIMLPPVLAALISIAILSITATPIHLMHILSILLILGIGIDYTIFLTEQNDNGKNTMLAIFLSAMTTMLSFSLLYLSQNPALKAIGITTFLGIMLSLILAPMVLVFHRKSAAEIK
ncbi:MAG: MMPL family transporter [Methylococcales bacterium]|nr:MMPL family transporter [Methylococcales bacterium]MBT7410177.1 MMPL family transporter [Methylococcales bacterium]